MLSVTGLNKFNYIRNFTDMRCKYSRVLAVIRHQHTTANPSRETCS